MQRHPKPSIQFSDMLYDLRLMTGHQRKDTNKIGGASCSFKILIPRLFLEDIKMGRTKSTHRNAMALAQQERQSTEQVRCRFLREETGGYNNNNSSRICPWTDRSVHTESQMRIITYLKVCCSISFFHEFSKFEFSRLGQRRREKGAGFWGPGFFQSALRYVASFSFLYRNRR